MSANASVSDALDHALRPAMAAPSTTTESARYHALDRVRALAMLLGVVYHTLLFRMFTGGGNIMDFMNPTSPSKILGDWLHSFRMPLFFVIAGFFARMMVVKYGTREFLRRRWWRIGLTLVIGMFTFGPIYVLTRELVSSPPSFGPGPGPPGPSMGRPGEFAGDPRPSPPRGAMAGRPGFAPAPGPGGFPPDGPPGRPGFRSGGGPPGGGPFGGGSGVANRIFGRLTPYVQLNHLWFLWYLLIFVTVAPFLTKGLAMLVPRSFNGASDGPGMKLMTWGLAPVILAVASTPMLLWAPPMMGWFLGLSPAIFRAFPDFLFHFDPDMGFYFAFFLTGWWLHREKLALPSVARAWLPNLLVGLGAFGIAMGLERQSRGESPMMMPMPTPDGGFARYAAYAIYCLGSACTSFAIIGVFLRYLDSPSRTWRYLADTALWVYLIHQPLVLVGLALARPLNLPWWALTAAVSVFTVVCSLVVYEAIIRPTPLVRLFGPSKSTKVALSEKIDGN